MAIPVYIHGNGDAFTAQPTAQTDKHLFLYDDGEETNSSRQSQTEQNVKIHPSPLPAAQ